MSYLIADDSPCCRTWTRIRDRRVEEQHETTCPRFPARNARSTSSEVSGRASSGGAGESRDSHARTSRSTVLRSTPTMGPVRRIRRSTP